MRLIEALQVVRSARERADVRAFALATGFTPLHLETFLTARLQQRLSASERAVVESGQFGDVVGNVRRATTTPAAAGGLAVVIEWPDLDRRLGVRESGAWSPSVLDDVLRTAESTMTRLASEIAEAAARRLVAVCLPTLALPPIAYTVTRQASAFELRLRALLAAFAAMIAEHARVRIVSDDALAVASPAAERASVQSELATGLPYTAAHAAVVAEHLAALLLPAAAKKGLITDLDDTLWRGLLGEVGVDGVAWSLERHAQVHGIYQRTLAALADSGVLIAVASKNDEALVESAFARGDLVLSRDRVFPLLASWGAKSKAVDAVLDAWNVGADSIVFVDDSPIELAEVASRHPDVVCLRFPKDDPDAVLALVRELRDLFGRPALQSEDALRRESLRSAATLRAAGADDDAFAASLDATITLACGDLATDARALELVNKTNQFNLNGRRYHESEWAARRGRADAVALAVSYADKFGALGKIAVVTGTIDDARVRVERWVMSCRAFARRIEHATLRALFDTYDVDEITLAYEPTPRNTPTREFLATLVTLPNEAAEIVVSRAAFERACPPLHHRIERTPLVETAHG